MLLARESLSRISVYKTVQNRRFRMDLIAYQVAPVGTCCKLQAAGRQMELEIAHTLLCMIACRSPVVTPYLLESVSQVEES